MWIKNTWYIAGWASEVTADALLSRTYLNTPVILYRDSAGKAVAMEDRCCHRHAPLSKGRLEGENVRCMYHGLMFAPNGQCIEIPGETKVADHLKVSAFPLVEKDKLLWIWMGDANLADPDNIIDCPFLDSPEWRYKEGSLHYKSNYKLIVDNLLDFSHLSYVHENSIGSSQSAQLRPEIKRTDTGVRINYRWDNDIPAPMIKMAGGFKGNVDRWNHTEWRVLGNILLMDSGSAEIGTGGADGDRSQAIEFRHLSQLTPETENSTFYFFAHTHNFARDNDKISDGVFNAVAAAFEEDKAIIEAQQRVIDLEPDRPMMAVSFDGPLLHIRRETDKIIKEESSSRKIAAE